MTCIYVSHRMPEIFRLCDTVTVLRDGRHVATRPTAAAAEADLVQMMIGRAVSEYFPRTREAAAQSEELLRVEKLSLPGKFEDVSFSLHAGEVVGLAGLVGAGRSESPPRCSASSRRRAEAFAFAAVTCAVRTPREAIELGIGLVPEDRKRQGLVLSRRAACETRRSPFSSDCRASAGSIARRSVRSRSDYFDRLRVRAPSVDAVVAGLSGGNQQKIVLAKWLAAKSKILILDEPTRGVDVGAKAEIHALIGELAEQGTAILLISSELPELLNLSDRILVLRAGRMVGEVARAEANQERLLRLMAGLA